MPSYLWYKKILDEFRESEHPRDDDGKFTEKNGGRSSGGSIESHIENTKSFVYQGGKVDLKGATNPENISLMNDALDEVQKKYPFHLEEISTFSSRGVRLAQAEGTHKLQVAKHFINMTADQKKEFYENNSSNYKNIIKSSIDNFRTKYLENEKVPDVVKRKAEAQIKQWEKDLRYERHNAISSPDMITKGIVWHEMGHILMARNSGDSGYLAQQAMNAAIATRDIYKIGRYAATNRYEFFAECFSLKMQGEELPSYVENMLKKVLEQ